VRRALLLIPLLLLGSCDGMRPPTPRKARLGQGVLSRLAPLRAEKVRDARGFLLDGLLHEAVADGVRFKALLDGALPDGASIRWQADGGELEVDGATALLRPAGRTWTVRAELLRGPRVTATAGATSGPDRFVELPPLLAAEGVPTHLSTDDCGDRRTPMRVVRGHVGCAPSDSPRLDLFVASGSSEAGPLPSMPRRKGKEDAAEVRPQEASIGAGILAWAGDGLGTWSGTEGAVHWLPKGPMIAPPAVGPENVAIVRADRIEVAKHGASQRTLLPLAPLEGPGTVALHHPWLAVVRTDGSLQLRDLAHNRGATVAPAGDRSDVQVDERWLTWKESGAAVWLDLHTGELRRVDVDAVRGRGSARLDDLWLIAANTADGVALTALHLPTGQTAQIVPAGGDLRLLGAASGGVSVAVGPFGGTTEAFSYDPALRQLEESTELPARPGGSGGRHGWLEEGTHVRTVAGGDGHIRVQVHAVAGAGRIEFLVGDTKQGEVELVDGAEAGWIDLGGSVILPGAGRHERRIEVRWTAGPGGLGVDALRVIRGGGA
jgi:hypothetical protein